MENVREALDSPGQWYLDRLEGRLYYLPRQGEDMQAVEIIAPRLTQLVRVVGWEGKPVKHVNFEGLTFSHTEWQPPADWAASLQGSTDVPGALYFDYAQNCSVRGGAIEHIGTYGIQVNMGCLEIEISHNRMADLGAGGVNVGHFYSNERSEQGERRTAWLPKGPRSERITVADNEITGTGQIYAGSAGGRHRRKSRQQDRAQPSPPSVVARRYPSVLATGRVKLEVMWWNITTSTTLAMAA